MPCWLNSTIAEQLFASGPLRFPCSFRSLACHCIWKHSYPTQTLTLSLEMCKRCPGCSRFLSRTASAISPTAAGAAPHSSVQDQLMFAAPCITKKGALVCPLVLTDHPGTLNHVEPQESNRTFQRATPCLYSWHSFRRGVQSSGSAPNSPFCYDGPRRAASCGTVLHTACPACRHRYATVETTALSPIAPEPRTDTNARTQDNSWKL